MRRIGFSLRLVMHCNGVCSIIVFSVTGGKKDTSTWEAAGISTIVHRRLSFYLCIGPKHDTFACSWDATFFMYAPRSRGLAARALITVARIGEREKFVRQALMATSVQFIAV